MRHFDVDKMTSFLYLWVLSVSLLPNVIMSYTEDISFAAQLCNLLIPAGAYLLVLSYCKKTWIGCLVMLPVMFLAAFQLVLFSLYDSSVISADMWLNLVTTNTSEVKELLGNLMSAIIIVVVLYLLPLVFAIISFFRNWHIPASLTKTLRQISLYSFIIGIISFCVANLEKRTVIANNIFPVNAVINLFRAIGSQSHVSNYKLTSSGFVFNAVCESHSDEKQVHIIVIGETSRAANWSMFGYNRNTTAALDTLSGIIGFNKALTQSNTTHKSVPILMSHIDGKHFGDSIYRVKGLISAYKEAGFSTAYFSNQQRNNSYIDFFGEEADNCVFINDNLHKGIKLKDSQLLDLIDDQLCKDKSKQLIVLHLYGSHFNYIDRYGEKSRKYFPDKYAEASKEYRDELINAYDNSITETSGFIYRIIKKLSDAHIYSTILYTSDHGEDIFDDTRNRFLHASPTPTYYQLHVPFMIWMSPEYLNENAEKAIAGQLNSESLVSSSSSVFHTALDLANIRCRVYNDTLSVVSHKYRSPIAGFLNGDNDFISLDNAGLTPLDFQKFREARIPITCKMK